MDDVRSDAIAATQPPQTIRSRLRSDDQEVSA